MDKTQINYLVATRIMGLEPFPGSECDVVTPGMVIGGDGSPLHQTHMKPYDYCGRIDLALDVAINVRKRINTMPAVPLEIGHLTLVDCGSDWGAAFYNGIEDIEEWWERVDEIQYTAKHENPATAICLAALEAVGVTVKGE